MENNTNTELNENSSSVTNLTGNINDYKLIVDLTREMKESVNNIRKQIQDGFESKGYIIPDVIEDMVILSHDDVESGDINKLSDYLKDHMSNKDSFSFTSDDEIRSEIKTMRQSFMTIHYIEDEYHSIINESKNILEEYFNYINSTKVDDVLKKRLEIMKSIQAVEDKANDKNQKMIDALEKTLDLSFLKDNLDVGRIADSFFSDKLSAYVIKRFKAKIKKYGYADNIYIHFVDIEETFMKEKYHPFNNLFLYIYMRYVGHSDPYYKEHGLYVRSITGSIANLIYHRFTNGEKEEEFIKFIESILDKFIDAGYTDRFIDENTSYKNNSNNIRARKVMEDQKRDLLTRKLKYYGIEYNDDMSIDELMKLFDDSYNELEKKRLSEAHLEPNTDEFDTVKDNVHMKADDIIHEIHHLNNPESDEDFDEIDEEDEDEYDDDDEYEDVTESINEDFEEDEE